MRSIRFLVLAGAAGLAFTILPRARAQQAASPPRVAVFGEKGFPYYNVTPLATPEQIAGDLRRAGVAVDLLDTRSLSSESVFNAKRYAAVVLPYGNTYPVDAFANLRRFHQAGGSLVTTGIPFTHGVKRDVVNGQATFNDQGHKDETARWGTNGIGVGGFTGGEMPDRPVAELLAPGDPMHLAGIFSGTDEGWHAPQWIDPKSIPAGVEIVPAVGDAAHPIVGLIVHKSDAFPGAVDAWMYSSPAGDRADYDQRRMLAHGVLAVLTRRGLLSAEGEAKGLASLPNTPPKVYANVTLPTVPRPYETFQPKMPPLARHLLVADLRKASFDERLLLISLQGIVNRKQPRIYLILDDDDPQWLPELQKQGETGAPVYVADPLSLVKTFRSEFRGAVLCDPKIYESPCVAASLAGANDLLVAMTPAIAKRAGVPVTEDLRGRFKDDAAAIRYLRTDIAPHLNPYLSCSLDPARYDKGGLDGVIAGKGSCFWITGPAAQSKPGANIAGEMVELREFLAGLPLGAVVRGFWWDGDGMGLSEDDGVALGSRFGKITLVSDLITNVSVHSGVQQAKLVQKPRPPAPALNTKKVYLSFTMSDGDNLCTWRGYFRSYFTDPLHGTFPVAYGMAPTLLDVAPTLAKWYYDHASPNTEFLCDVSGVGYMYPPDWAKTLKDRSAATRSFYDWTQNYMARMDMKTVRLMNVRTEDIAGVGRDLPGVAFLMPDYGTQGGDSYSHFTYTLPTGQPVFRAVSYGPGPERLAGEVRGSVGQTRPAFVNAFIWNWGSKLSDLKAMLDLLGPEYVAVTPTQLNALYREAHAVK
jgi:hypothetical protein